ncbi:MAG: hypothetical protein QQN55_08735, partial [Nitrosopumilus sp.]
MSYFTPFIQIIARVITNILEDFITFISLAFYHPCKIFAGDQPACRQGQATPACDHYGVAPDWCCLEGC